MCSNVERKYNVSNIKLSECTRISEKWSWLRRYWYSLLDSFDSAKVREKIWSSEMNWKSHHSCKQVQESQ